MSAPLRLVYVINGLGTGGAERSLAEMLPLLDARHVEVTVVCLHHRSEGVEREVLDSGVDVRFLTKRHLFGRIRELRRVITEVRPAIVHTTLFDSDVAGRVAALGTGARVLSSLVNASYGPERLTDPNVSALKLRLARLIDALTARHMTYEFHAITNAVKDASVERLRIDPRRVSVVERGRDEARLGRPSPERRAAIRRALGLAADAPVLLNIGRHEHQKGQVDLVAAVALLAGDRPDLVLLVAGRRGNATGAIEAAVARHGVGANVRLLGHRPDVADLLVAADVLVFPSLYEGLGGSVIEAMAMALPVVATRIPALVEVLEDGAYADLVPSHDPEALAAAVANLLDDPDKRHAYGVRGRAAFEERFQLERSVERMLDLYEMVAAG